MEIYTSYYDNISASKSGKYTFIRVSRWAPPETFTALVPDYVDYSDVFGPSEELLAECPPNGDWELFKERYEKEVLGVLDPDDIIRRFQDIYVSHGRKPLVLTCFEAPPEHCHRELIGPFLNMNIKEIS